MFSVSFSSYTAMGLFSLALFSIFTYRDIQDTRGSQVSKDHMLERDEMKCPYIHKLLSDNEKDVRKARQTVSAAVGSV